MTLPSRPMHIPAGAGINEATRSEWIEFGAASLTNENVRQGKRMGLGKRWGFRVLARTVAGSYNYDQAIRLTTDRDATVRVVRALSGVHELHAYDAGNDTWVALRGSLSECTQRLIDVPSMSTSSFLQDVAYGNGYLAVVWYVLNGFTNVDTYAAILRADTGAVVSPPVKVGTVTSGTAPMVVAVGGPGTYGFIIVRADSGAATLKAWSIFTNSAASIASGWSAMTDFATDVGSPNRYAVVSLGATAALVYTNNSVGTSRITAKVFGPLGVTATQTINTSSTTVSAVDIAGVSTDTLWVGWNEATAVKAIGLNPSTLATVAATATVLTATTGVSLIGIGAPFGGTGGGRMIVNSSSTTMQSHTRGWTTSGATVTPSGSTVTVYAAQACGKPGIVNGRMMCAIYGADTGNAQNQIVICDVSETTTFFRPVACPAPGLATTDLVGKRSIIAGDSGKYFTPLTLKKSGVTEGSAVVELDFASLERFQGARVGSSLYLNGGITQYSDDARVAEASFLFRPTTPTFTAGGSGITLATGRRYVCVYEEVDADGNWHVSGVSTPSASTGAQANKTITVSTSPLTVTGRVSSTGAATTTVRVAFYATLDGAVPPYYRLGTTINDTSASTVTFADAVADLALATGAKLYEQPGVLGTAQDRRSPPGFLAIVEYAGMLIGLTASELWYSGQPVYGEGTWFNPIFSQPVEGGTALAVMDGTLFVFTRRGIFACAGEPPSDNAAAGGLGGLQRLAVDVGCVTQRSIVVTGAGVFFQSERGLELLNRSRAVDWIGESVQDTLAAFPVITSATLDTSQSLVYFECASGSSSGLVTGTGRTLVFDLRLNAWVSADRRADYAATADAPAQGAAYVYTSSGYRYTWLSSDGRAYVEDRTTHLDTGAWVTARWETADLKFGLQQEQRVYNGVILFERASAAGLTIECAYNGAGYTDTKTWTEAATLSKSQLDFRPRPFGQRTRFRVTDTAPAELGTGQGFTWIGMSFDAAPKQGPTKATPNLAPTDRR